MENTTVPYRRAKNWQFAFFCMNNTATNCYGFLMGYLTYYATGVAGLGVLVVGIIATVSRLWDGVTDPLVGIMIDRMNGKFGKFRPAMVIGEVIMAVTSLIMFNTVHLLPESFRLIYYILIYALYIIGYTFQTACTKAGQSCLTNDPAQRPQFVFYDNIFGTIINAVLPIIASGSLYVWAGGFNEAYFKMFTIITIVLAAVLTAFAIIGIAEHDNEKYFGGAADESGKEKVTLKDAWQVLTHNRALQCLVISEASDKLAGRIKYSSVTMVVLFGIFLGDFSAYGRISGIASVLLIGTSALVVMYAAKKGMRTTLVNGTKLDFAVSFLLLAAIIFSYMNGYTGANAGIWRYVIVALYGALYIVEMAVLNITNPMIADCTDYEVVRSGRHIPGLIGTLFSFVDKLVSSLFNTVTSIALVMIGYNSVQPDPSEALTNDLFLFLLATFFGVSFIGWALNLISMKFYPLTKEKMEEIEAQIAEMGIKKEA